ncbi:MULTISPECIES: hypothetical protein [Pediococcus]|uniref:hypothetical protein n=1 Tax=Pediococcus TaxID=1253 RepID=UPI000E91E9AA|nr:MULTISPECIES: hypothetical protein [Pediococcus]MCT3029503.1 hypothetical protein [Pediococcus parvulus]MCT3035113.1 hypothetical protein [Pediococcus parvulus]HBO47313.1 hypothetical protein [Pediococcus sp.]
MKKQKRIVVMGCSFVVGLALLGIGGTTMTNNNVTVHAVTTPADKGLAAPEKVDGTQTEVQTVTGNSTSGKVTYSNGANSATTATYKQQKYGTTSQAKTGFENTQNLTNADGTKVTLSDGTKATSQGVMGHVYVQWQKNGWTVTTVADTEDLTTSSVNQTNKTVTAVANKVKKSLKSNKVITQNVTRGNVVVYDGAQQKPVNNISWQQKNKVVQVSGNSAETTAKIAKEAIK